jgi:hypothetical protein
MPTTTKMGIAYPASTDLVKDGATNMGTIATTVDAKTGLILLSTTTFSATSGQSISNCFSATYDNYRILVDLTAVTADGDAWLRLRTGSTDVTANYQVALRGINNVGTSADTTSASLSYFFLNKTDNGNSNHMYQSTVELGYPFLAQRTTANLQIAGVDSSGNFVTLIGSSCNTNATSYESLSIGCTAGTITGSISIFAYNK